MQHGEMSMDVKVDVGAIQDCEADAVIISLFEGTAEPGGAAGAAPGG